MVSTRRAKGEGKALALSRKRHLTSKTVREGQERLGTASLRGKKNKRTKEIKLNVVGNLSKRIKQENGRESVATK